jgi:peptide/nickel transport system substrate-binding protein
MLKNQNLIDDAKCYETMRVLRWPDGVIPMMANMVDAASSKLKFENPATNWELDGMRLTERWWFEP